MLGQQEKVKILFVGNSFTYFYNLPQVLSSMAKSQGDVIITRQSTVGGSNLEQHWKRLKGTKTRELLESKKWDYVVFNNHSKSAIDTPDDFMKYGKKFAALVKQKGAKPIFMMTWAYKSDPSMQPEITKMYKKLSQITNSDYVPCGPIFEKTIQENPKLNLFFDDKHPSYIGTYLLGLTFYKYFTGKSTSKIPNRLTTTDFTGEKLYLIFMHQKEANFLQNLVDNFSFKTL
jgi:hypothetical protein